jgi:hypothetical protein
MPVPPDGTGLGFEEHLVFHAEAARMGREDQMLRIEYAVEESTAGQKIVS